MKQLKLKIIKRIGKNTSFKKKFCQLDNRYQVNNYKNENKKQTQI